MPYSCKVVLCVFANAEKGKWLFVYIREMANVQVATLEEEGGETRNLGAYDEKICKS